MQLEVEDLRNCAKPHLVTVQAHIARTWVDERLLNPDRWRPLIMGFCAFYRLGGVLRPWQLAEVF